MKFSLKTLWNRIENNKPEHMALSCAWVLLIILSFVIGDAKLIGYIHQNVYTKLGVSLLIQVIAFVLIMSLKKSTSKIKENN